MSVESIAAKFASIEDKLAIRRTAVLFTTVWMSWRSFTWAAEYAREALLHSVGTEGIVAAAALVAAVTAPIAYLQKSVFAAYLDSKNPQPTA